MFGTKWQLYPQYNEIANKIASQLNTHKIIAQILLNRKISSITEAHNFLNLHVQSANHPFCVKDMEKASEIIYHHQQRKSKILLFGDYDVDGITSTALLFRFLNIDNPHVDFYIPDRFQEGYGLNSNVVEFVKNHKYELLITLDCGISDYNEIDELTKAGLVQVIVLDHHNVADVIPNASALINPKLEKNIQSNYYLAAVGVVYAFLEFYLEKYNFSYDLVSDLDIVALGTVADVVPLIGRNRVIVSQGLKLLQTTQKIGLQALLDVIGIKNTLISARDIGFKIAPYLNASGRLEKASLGVQLLITKDSGRAYEIAKYLKTLNMKRQQMGMEIQKQAKNIIVNQKNLDQKHILVIEHEGWHAGIIGITASQIVKQYSRPTVLIATQGKMGRASARSFGQINIYKILKKCRHFFDEFGGHKQAAGFSIEKNKIAEFIQYVSDISKIEIQKQDLISIIDIDTKLDVSLMTLDLAKEVKKLAPFGQQNPEPIFYNNDLRVLDCKTVGNGSHLKVTFSDQVGSFTIDGIGFGLANKIELLYKKNIELAFQLDINQWAGREIPQLKLIDIK